MIVLKLKGKWYNKPKYIYFFKMYINRYRNRWKHPKLGTNTIEGRINYKNQNYAR